MVNTTIQGVEELEPYFSQFLPQLILAVIIPVTYLVVVIQIDVLSAVVFCVTAPLIPLFMFLIGSKAELQTKKQWKTLSRLSAYFLEVIQGLPALKLLGRSREQVEKLKGASEDYRKTTMSVLRVTFLSALVLELITTLATAIVAVQIGLRLLYGWIEFEQAFLILLLAPEFYSPLRMLGLRFHAAISGHAAGERIFSLLDDLGLIGKKGKFEEAAHPSPANVSRELPGEIVFKDVSFQYPGGEAILHGVSFTIKAGEKTAIVGLSGAGKSTLAALLMGFIKPSSGEIWMGANLLKQNIEGLSPISVAWVPQTPYLFHDSVAKNVRLGKPEASQAEMILAAQKAHADEFIQRLPRVYETVIGERGARLSAGQAQRIALARAFLMDAPLIILDEGTANLDPETEDLIQASVEALIHNKTVIWIAHRINTIKGADQIIVLEQGKVIQQGQHEALIKEGGLYTNLVVAALGSEKRIEEHNGQRISERVAWIEPRIERNLQWALENQSSFSMETEGDGEGEKIKTWQLWASLWEWLKPSPAWIVLSIVFGTATILCGMGLMGASAYIISAAALHPSIATLQIAIVGVRFFGLGRGCFRYVERLFSHDATFRILAQIRVSLFQGLDRLKPARIVGFRSGDLLSRATQDISGLEAFYVRSVAPPVIGFLIMLITSAYLVSYGMEIFLGYIVIALAVAGFLPALVSWISKKPGAAVTEAKQGLSVAILDGLQGLADLCAYRQVKNQVELVRSENRKLVQAQAKISTVQAVQVTLGLVGTYLGGWAVLYLAISRVENGAIAGVYLAVLGLVALFSFEAITPLPAAAQSLTLNLEATRRLLEITHRGEISESPNSANLLPEQYDLEITGLRFAYPVLKGMMEERDEKTSGLVLDGIDISLPRGKKIAIVGPSGVGKTTLIQLILGFWDVYQGTIFINKQNHKQYTSEQLCQNLAVVPQGSFLFNGTIRDNLLLAQSEANEVELEEACRLAQIDEFVDSLPDGLDTWVGEQGLRLSGGERQRIILARAMLKKSPLLILDEPTANLDAITELRVMEAILRSKADQSIILCTHRLVAMETLDEILVLKEGRVKEAGSHEELLKVGGYYERMWNLQHQA
jgi:ATP-binding cassette subfamily C protein CydCD